METEATVSYKGLRFPAEIISHAVWLYHRFPLSFREVEELLMVRGIVVSGWVEQRIRTLPAHTDTAIASQC